MAEVNWDFAVERHQKTLGRIAFEEGKDAANARAAALGLSPAFKKRVIAAFKGEDINGSPY